MRRESRLAPVLCLLLRGSGLASGGGGGGWLKVARTRPGVTATAVVSSPCHVEAVADPAWKAREGI